eukprot:2594520-Alexandrium_andersonii.AAC.1
MSKAGYSTRNRNDATRFDSLAISMSKDSTSARDSPGLGLAAARPQHGLCEFDSYATALS